MRDKPQQTRGHLPCRSAALRRITVARRTRPAYTGPQGLATAIKGQTRHGPRTPGPRRGTGMAPDCTRLAHRRRRILYRGPAGAHHHERRRQLGLFRGRHHLVRERRETGRIGSPGRSAADLGSGQRAGSAGDGPRRAHRAGRGGRRLDYRHCGAFRRYAGQAGGHRVHRPVHALRGECSPLLLGLGSAGEQDALGARGLASRL